ncbi:hypothetical protein Tco_1510373, partial [Tanacetum coccineum]
MVKNKILIAEAYEWDEEEVSSDDNEMVEFKVLMALAEDNDAISKEGFHNCTSRSRYWGVSKQTTRHLPHSYLRLTLEGFPFVTVNTKEYHSECS